MTDTPPCERQRLRRAETLPQLFQKAIASQPQHEQRLLAGAAVCVQKGFWLPLAAQIANLGEDEADDAADHLVNSSLLSVLDREGRRFQLHAILLPSNSTLNTSSLKQS